MSSLCCDTAGLSNENNTHIWFDILRRLHARINIELKLQKDLSVRNNCPKNVHNIGVCNR